MVNCNNCKFFKAECIENVFAGICEHPILGEDYLELWQIESGTCDMYEPMDRNLS